MGMGFLLSCTCQVQVPRARGDCQGRCSWKKVEKASGREGSSWTGVLAKMSDGVERTFVTGVVVKAMICRK